MTLSSRSLTAPWCWSWEARTDCRRLPPPGRLPRGRTGPGSWWCGYRRPAGRGHNPRGPVQTSGRPRPRLTPRQLLPLYCRGSSWPETGDRRGSGQRTLCWTHPGQVVTYGQEVDGVVGIFLLVIFYRLQEVALPRHSLVEVDLGEVDVVRPPHVEAHVQGRGGAGVTGRELAEDVVCKPLVTFMECQLSPVNRDNTISHWRCLSQDLINAAWLFIRSSGTQ